MQDTEIGIEHQRTDLVTLAGERADQQRDEYVYTFLADGERVAEALTFGELDRRARSIAATLQDRGLSGERALLLYPPGLEFAAAFFGCLYAGVTAVPAYPPRINRSVLRLEAILADAGAKVILTEGSAWPDVAERVAPLLEGGPESCLRTDEMEDRAAAWRKPEIDPSSLAFLQYTSGSTGDPKGVMVSHGNILHNSSCLRHTFQASGQSVGLSWLPVFHDMGLLMGIIQPVFTGFHTYLMAPAAFLQRPLRWLQAISRFRATISGAPCFAYELCVEAASSQEPGPLDLSCWNAAYNGAEPIRAGVVEQFARVFQAYGYQPGTHHPGYGMAETTLVISASSIGQEPVVLRVEDEALRSGRIRLAENEQVTSTALVGSGRAVPDTRIEIVDPESCVACPAGEVGEIWVAGPSVAQGYWGRAEESRSTFQATLKDTGEGPFLRTGDLGFMHVGELFIAGRRKDLIIIHGLNHYPQDIEAAIEGSHAALSAGTAAAFAVEVDGEERLAAVVEVKRSARRNLDVAGVFRAVRRAVAEAFDVQIHAIELLKPGGTMKTSSGKIQRRACRQGFLDRGLESVGRWEANVARAAASEATSRLRAGELRTAIENWLSDYVAGRAGLLPAEIDAGRPFTDYGLGSLDLVRMTGQLERWLGRELPQTLAYDSPTIAAVARGLAEADAPGTGRATESSPIGDDGGRGALEPIAIVGLGCRFPGAEDAATFWHNLHAGVDSISEPPAERAELGLARAADGAPGGYLDGVDRFDAAFFDIAPHEACLMDPQQRMLLEMSWTAIEDAGWNPQRLAGSATGVFIGISASDYFHLLTGRSRPMDAYLGTGGAESIAANRISYFLDLRGPSMAVDTACSSSLVAIHLACRSLRSGECRAALAGGVNLILSEQVTEAFREAGMLSPSGRCATFDAGADGYVRGEGCGVVFMKRLSDALADGDPIHAVIRGSAVNQDGRSNGLTAPNGPAQQEVIRQALADADVSPAEVEYVEAHGTGTSLGDPIEVQALGAVYGEGRSADRPMRIGSVKTNLGHLEAAAGIAGLIKVVLAMRHGSIPPSLHFGQPNPYIAWEKLPLRVTETSVPWKTEGARRLAGVSSFGFGGTNAHVIVEDAPRVTAGERSEREPSGRGYLLRLSARCEAGLRALAERYAEVLESADRPRLEDVCRTANLGRGHFEHRLAVVAESAAEMAERLRAFARGANSQGSCHGRATRGARENGRIERGSGGTDNAAAREDESNALLTEQWHTGVSDRSVLERLGRRYAEGAKIDWEALHGEEPPRRIALPTYPFQRQSYWFTNRDTAVDARVSDRGTELPDAAGNREGRGTDDWLYEVVWEAVGNRDESSALLAEQWHTDGDAGKALLTEQWHTAGVDEIRVELGAELARLLARHGLTDGRDDTAASQHDAAAERECAVAGSETCERRAMDHVVVALDELGVRFAEGESVDPDALGGRAGVQARHRRLLRRMFEMLAEEGYLEVLRGEGQGIGAGQGSRDRQRVVEGKQTRGDRGFRVRRVPDVAAARERLGERTFAAGDEVLGELLDRCGSALATVLRGECDPLQLLFPQDDGVSAEQLYRDAPAARVLNALVAKAVVEAGGLGHDEAAGGNGSPRAGAAVRKLRILEIGAGTGGTTSAVLPKLPADRVEYTFTDVSALFLGEARSKLGEYPFVDFRLLDIERSPEAQGFARYAYDIVIAANVLHATADVRRSLEHVRGLLAPGGVLVLLEGTARQRWLDLTFGLLEGWWRFADADLRLSYPLLTPEQWGGVLGEVGFGHAAAIPEAGANESALLRHQRVLLAQAPDAVETDSNDRRDAGGRWLVFADESGTGEALADALVSVGGSCVLVRRGKRFLRSAPDRYRIKPSNAEHLNRLLDRIAADGGEPLRGIVFLWGLDAASSESTHGREIESETTALCDGLVHVVRAVRRDTSGSGPGIWVVTRGAESAGMNDIPVSLAQAPLCGLAQVLALEHPRLWRGLIDLDPAGGDDFERIAGLLCGNGAEDRVAIRDGRSLVPRLVRVKAAAEQAPAIRGDARYLITGGLGGVGLEVANWLVARGARRLVLVGRRGLEASSAEEADTLSVRRRAVEDLRARGAEVEVFAADAAEADQLAEVFKRIEDGPPLRGVIHAAGVPGFAAIEDLTSDLLAEVLRPKVAGAWNLHQLTRELELDFFVCFSSASSVLGASRQGHYAAANRFLDALACHRAESGLPALSVNWGRWQSESGMLSADAHAWFDRVGLLPMSPEMATEAMGRVLGTGRSQAMIAAVDWSLFKPLYEAQRRRPILERIAAGAAPRIELKPEEAAGGEFIERLRSAAARERRELLAAHIERQLAAILGLAPGTRPDRAAGFFEMGMDSLMAIALKSRLEKSLGRALPRTLAFEHPTVAKLAGFLLDDVLADLPSHAEARVRASVRTVETAEKRIDHEAIAIVGMSCRLPGGADSPEAFWRLMRDGNDAIEEVPRNRWDIDAYYEPDPDAPGGIYTRFGGFVRDVDQFDPEFFGIAPREAASMDPQHRLLLEVAWEALERGGCDPKSLRDTRGGVFVGITASDYGDLLAEHGAVDAYYITGNSLNASAGRLSYLLGLQGPSLAVDAACASSLVAVHLACRSLRSGESDVALAGGVNLILSPNGTLAACRAKMLSADGRCRTFDASAAGFVRSEGCGVVVLRRLSDALAGKDPILAVIRGSGTGQDGASGGLTVPSAQAQAAVIREALADAEVKPDEVDYVEAHGTGTSLGDPIEFRAVQSVFEGVRGGRTPLMLGSVKTNIGHLESASGIAGLIKTVLALQHEELPAHLHLERVNPDIVLESIPAMLPTAGTPWRRGDRRRIAGVSSFGASGSLAHVVVEEAPAGAPVAAGPAAGPQLFTISARSETALRAAMSNAAAWLDGHPETSLGDVCYTASAGRAHHEYRLGIVAESVEQLRDRITALLEGDAAALQCEIRRPVRVGLTLGNVQVHGSSNGTGRGWNLPALRRAIERCNATIGHDGTSRKNGSATGQTSRRCEAIDAFACEYAWTSVLRSWGVDPQVVAGEGIGILAAACVADAISLEDAVRIAGAWDADDAGFEAALSEVTVASPRMTLVCGKAGKGVSREDLGSAGWWHEQRGGSVRSSRSIHRMAGYLDVDVMLRVGGLTKDVAGESPGNGGLNGAAVVPVALGGDQEWRTVLDAVGALYARGVDIDWSEFHRDRGGRKILLPTYPFQRQRCWFTPRGERKKTGTSLLTEQWHTGESASRTDESASCADEENALLAEQWHTGDSTSHTGVGERKAQPAEQWHGGEKFHPLLGRKARSPLSSDIRYENRISARWPEYLGDHRLRDRVIFPATAYLEMAIAAVTRELAAGQTHDRTGIVLKDVRFTEAMILDGQGEREVQLVLSREDEGAFRFQVFSAPPPAEGEEDRWTVHASGTTRARGVDAARRGDSPGSVRKRCNQGVDVERFYRGLADRGMEYGAAFRNIAELWSGDGEALGRIRSSGHEAGGYVMHPAMLDACSHVVGAAGGDDGFYLFAGVEEMRVYGSAGEALWAHARLRSGADGDDFIADLKVFDAQWWPVAEIDGLKYRRAGAVRPTAAEDGVPRAPRAEAGSNGSSKPAALFERLAAAAPEEREAMLTDHIAGQTATVLGLSKLSNPKAGFFDLGMDSLMAVELRNALQASLGRALPATVVFDHANVQSLTGFILSEVLELAPRGAAAVADKRPERDLEPDAADLDDLSTDELAALFAEQIEQTREGQSS